MEQGRFGGIELRTYLAVARDLPHPEQCLTVRPALTSLQMALMRQKGRALHEERRERGEGKIGHVVGRVQALPLVGQQPTATAQGIEKAILDWHTRVESQFSQ